MELVAFYVFLIMSIIGLVTFFVNKKFQTGLNFLILAVLIGGVVFLSQKGNKSYKIGAVEIKTQQIGELEVKTQGGNNQAKFEITNSTNQTVNKEIKFTSTNVLDNIEIGKGNNYISIIEGGKGNNYVVYNVNIPAKTLVSGTMVSSSALSILPQEIKKEKQLPEDAKKTLNY